MTHYDEQFMRAAQESEARAEQIGKALDDGFVFRPCGCVWLDTGHGHTLIADCPFHHRPTPEETR